MGQERVGPVPDSLREVVEPGFEPTHSKFSSRLYQFPFYLALISLPRKSLVSHSFFFLRAYFARAPSKKPSEKTGTLIRLARLKHFWWALDLTLFETSRGPRRAPAGRLGSQENWTSKHNNLRPLAPNQVALGSLEVNRIELSFVVYARLAQPIVLKKSSNEAICGTSEWNPNDRMKLWGGRFTEK